MSDPNWISAANDHHPEPVLSKIRADFGHESERRIDTFCGSVDRQTKRYPTPPRTTLGHCRLRQLSGRNAALRHLTGPFWR